MADIYTIPSAKAFSTPLQLIRHRKQRSEPTSQVRFDEPKTELQNGPSWGRAGSQATWSSYFVAGSWVFFAPLTSLTAYVTLYHFDGSIIDLAKEAAQSGLINVLLTHLPSPSSAGFLAWLGWITLQAVLYLILPGPTRTGQYTPAGHLLSYRVNGQYAFGATVVFCGALLGFGLIDAAFIVQNWAGIVAAMNISGLLLSVFAFLKAYLAPTHPDDCKFSGCALFDFYMGIEMNPRIGSFDFKLFNNGRSGLAAWVLIDLSNLAHQYNKYGGISPALVLTTFFHALYVWDFFVNEAWYLRTIDIAHDHFGFYLGWGCFAWLPTMYTLQAQYLGRRDPAESPSALYLGIVALCGFLGYALFRSVNGQKETARSTMGQCQVWGKAAECIQVQYETSDGSVHKSVLLCSGWWGLARHVNYLGDVILSWSICALAGHFNVFVLFYGAYMTVLLVHRCIRDEERGQAKYGAAWADYCRRVPWRLIPGLW